MKRGILETIIGTRANKRKRERVEAIRKEIQVGKEERWKRKKERRIKELEENTLLKNEKFLEIIGVEIRDHPSDTFDLGRESVIMKSKIPEASPPNYNGVLPMNLGRTYSCIDKIWDFLKSFEIDPKTSEIMKKAVDLVYATKSTRFISTYLNYFIFSACEAIKAYEERGQVSDPLLFHEVIESFCTSLLYTAEDIPEYYSEKRLETPALETPAPEHKRMTSLYESIKDLEPPVIRKMEEIQQLRELLYERRELGLQGGKKTKNKSKRKTTNKKKSRKSTNKKKSRKSRKSTVFY